MTTFLIYFLCRFQGYLHSHHRRETLKCCSTRTDHYQRNGLFSVFQNWIQYIGTSTPTTEYIKIFNATTVGILSTIFFQLSRSMLHRIPIYDLHPFFRFVRSSLLHAWLRILPPNQRTVHHHQHRSYSIPPSQLSIYCFHKLLSYHLSIHFLTHTEWLAVESPTNKQAMHVGEGARCKLPCKACSFVMLIDTHCLNLNERTRCMSVTDLVWSDAAIDKT